MKKLINQNDKLNEELINTIEANFVFEKKPINRFSKVEKESDISQRNKQDLLENLKKLPSALLALTLIDSVNSTEPALPSI